MSNPQRPVLDDPKCLVSTDWLAQHLRDPDLRVIDASWYLPAAGRDGRAEYAAAHLPGARFFDIDAISDPSSGLPHMAPSDAQFVAQVRALGIGDQQQIVVYDGAGLFSAARVWWMFRLMGKTEVAVLDGGLPKWRAEGRPLETTTAPLRERPLTVARRPELLADVICVAKAAKLGLPQILDARATPRFEGRAPEPRQGLRAGHIPGAMSLPFTELLAPDGTLLPPEALRRAFEGAGVDLSAPIITSCGSGVTAAVLALGLERIGHHNWSLYDGSWAEWGMYEDLPVETGPAQKGQN